MCNDFKVDFDEILEDTCLAIINPVFSLQYVAHLGLPFKNVLP